MRSRLVILVCGVMIWSGCSWDLQALRSQSPDRETRDEGSGVRLVGDLAVPYGLFPVSVEAVGLVTGLHGTGGDPRPSPYRAVLLAEMRTRGVAEPTAVLASPNTALVLVRGVLPPGIQKGDPFDVEVRIPSQSETISLRGGRLLEARLKPMAVLSDHRVHDGQVLGLAGGPVMVDPAAGDQENRVLLGRGLILGGGRCLRSRNLGLVLKPQHQSVFNSARVENAVNKRFYSSEPGLRTGMAKAIDDEYLELKIHPRYRYNIQRYVAVVRSIALREDEVTRRERLALLEKQLVDPITAARAALQLEAIGSQAVDSLRHGLQSSDPEVRFYAAEALAYLDVSDAARALAEAARKEPAFRAFALTALSALGDYAAVSELRQLLNGRSAETRYGAFRALWAANPHDPLVMGQNLGGQFSYHVLRTTGTPMIHATASKRPEIVLFGPDHPLRTPLILEAGNQILITSTDSGEIAVSRYSVADADQRRLVASQLDEVIRAIVDLGGTYPDVVQAIQQAKAKGVLDSRFEVDALPEGGRTYRRRAQLSQDQPGQGSGLLANSPFPDLFNRQAYRDRDRKGKLPPESGDSGPEGGQSGGNRGRLGAFFAKMMGR